MSSYATDSDNGQTNYNQTEVSKKKPKKITIKGIYNVPPKEGEMIVLSEVVDKKSGQYNRIDSVLVKKMKFTFSSKKIKPGSYVLSNTGNQMLPIYLDYGQSNITVDSSFPKSKISGNELDSLLKQYDALNMLAAMAQIGYAFKALSYKDKGEEVPEEEEKEFIKNFTEISERQKSFTRKLGMRKDLTSAYVIVKGGADQFTNEEINDIYSSLSASEKDSHFGKDLKVYVDKINTLAVGVKAPDFTQENPDGKNVRLSDFIQGKKVVLIDFWASWCAPCRKENPNVVALYNEYNSKGFDIIGVSLDEDRDNWLKAIDDDKLTWTHVSDLEGWKNVVAQQYNVTAVPLTILLDADGKIIAKNLRGDDLRKKVAEICN